MPSHSSVESGLILAAASGLIRMTGVASLATLESGSGHPYASLITIATETGGAPILLISTLAWHTCNLEADPRASILFSATSGSGDPLDLGRVSLMGTAERTTDARARSRFLARHPSAALYAGFADFSFWRLKVERAHYVGGFGRITTFDGDEVLLDAARAEAWDAEVDAAIDSVNAGQGELIARLAGRGETGPWRVAACDPYGCDLVLDERAVRLTFPAAISAPSVLLPTLLQISEQAAPEGLA